ncbi:MULTISPECIES: M50 family metallopeptidase [Aneurinibacillus]|uniref:M50 family metallopeptidase n=1 Tax=Aneurinibacillus thermoaerophilus TaxID=143495 RepID=A0A1G7ZR80_ANETH|nr:MULTISPECIES: M50 family metallopeptidase [Aneurinibacillus]AMA72129.1 hypothetical protein ACH33_04200 [Aneurinibacillus sp. XH2]MED0676414.1 M50 family metallopeptidase [Aneurinibacillus thermoaerophilus]MED0678926.1 M50 family metallopeptidase [Aneurinibacillus thermoaerophilus]MED0736463.1 M50 family metallopeptidase [Aneurinibacillus thermoaerophilus]MED0755966.1 M50 family metallopeptidase [Aneurinibacillus thermoaerophilus]
MNNISLHVHPLFWLIMLGALLVGQFMEVITLFSIVLLHELGHVTAARWYGWRVKRIELLPFGGVLEIEEWGNTMPGAEFVVALAGPLVNALLIVFGLAMMQLEIWSSVWTAFFVYSNLLIGGFNLLPIWPLDGGRVMQTALSLVLPYRQAMLWSIYISGAGAAGLIAWSLSFEPSPHLNGLAVAFYLLFSAWMAYRQRHVQFIRFLLARKTQLEEGLGPEIERLVSVPPTLTLAQAVKKIKRNSYQFFIVHGRSLPSSGTVFSEKVLLAYYFSGRSPHCAVEELLR